MEGFDDKFRKQVTETFRHYDAGHLADEGWDAFLKTHIQKRRRALLIPLWAKAASIAVVIGLASLLTIRFLSVYGPSERIASSDESLISKPDATGEAEAIIAGEPVEISEISEVSEEKYRGLLTIDESRTEAKPVLTEGKDASATDIRQGKHTFSGDNPQPYGSPLKGYFRLGHVISQNRLDNHRLAGEAPVGSGIMSEDNHGVADEERTSLMAGVSGMVAQVDNAIASSPGVAMGFYLEHRLTGRISVRPGLALAKQSSGLESSNVKSALGYAAPSNNVMTGLIDSYQARMDVLALELPVNVVVSLWRRGKSSLFFSTGLSTMVYLRQSYSGSFNNAYTGIRFDSSTGNNVPETTYSVTSFESEYSSFSHADLLGLANFSAGYSVPLGENHSMLVEPFVQLPVRDLTSRNIRIRYGGMSVKLSFGK